jgi:hypothetical protein
MALFENTRSDRNPPAPMNHEPEQNAKNLIGKTWSWADNTRMSEKLSETAPAEPPYDENHSSTADMIITADDSFLIERFDGEGWNPSRTRRIVGKS